MKTYLGLRGVLMLVTVLIAGRQATAAEPDSFSTEVEVASAESPVAGSPAAPKPLVFTRCWEANERAYSYLAPKGWRSAGGLFHVNPLKMNGPVNSIMPKNDLTVKRDDGGSVYFRWLPVWIYADLSRSPTAAMTAHLFPVGTHYQGMEVRPMPTWKEYLEALFRSLHPQAEAVRVSEAQELPRLADLFRRRDRAVIEALLPFHRSGGGGYQRVSAPLGHQRRRAHLHARSRFRSKPGPRAEQHRMEEVAR